MAAAGPHEHPYSPAPRARAEVEELQGAGATYVREQHYDGALGHVVMLDPEGNEVCVA